MNIKTFLVALSCASCVNALAQTSDPSTPEETALGWKFGDCFTYYLLSGELAKRDGDQKTVNALKFAQEASFSASVALVGEENFRSEASTRRSDFIRRMKSPPISERLKAIEEECRELLDTKLEVAAPKVFALAKKKQQEKGR